MPTHEECFVDPHSQRLRPRQRERLFRWTVAKVQKYFPARVTHSCARTGGGDDTDSLPHSPTFAHGLDRPHQRNSRVPPSTHQGALAALGGGLSHYHCTVNLVRIRLRRRTESLQSSALLGTTQSLGGTTHGTHGRRHVRHQLCLHQTIE